MMRHERWISGAGKVGGDSGGLGGVYEKVMRPYQTDVHTPNVPGSRCRQRIRDLEEKANRA